MRVSPLRYASLIKWFTNQSEGIPAYIKIDMATQNTELVKLDEGMKYTTSDHFNRNIYRHLRFKYPTYIFNDLSFEIDDNGVPYWISPVKKFNIGLFGGTTVGRVVYVMPLQVRRKIIRSKMHRSGSTGRTPQIC